MICLHFMFWNMILTLPLHLYAHTMHDTAAHLYHIHTLSSFNSTQLLCLPMITLTNDFLYTYYATHVANFNLHYI